jgi:hypothetical protein
LQSTKPKTFKKMNISEAQLREKASHYLVCYVNQCPLHESCLRWKLGPYKDPEEHVIECQNPMDKHATDGQCVNYRNATPVRMPLGMKQAFYHDMPHHIERSIKDTLINHYGRTNYYRYHSAHRPITPDVLQVIQSVCQRFGWTQPLQFDAEVEDYVW